MSRYIVRYRPASGLSRNVELGLHPAPVIPVIPDVEEELSGSEPPPDPCVPNITGLIWIDPITLAEQTNDFVLELKEMGLDIDAGGPGGSVNYWFPKSNLNYEFRIKGTLCCDCTVAWTADWVGDNFPPGFRGRWDWAILIPQGEVDSPDLPQGEGTMTISAIITCPEGVSNVGPIVVTVQHET